MDDLKLSVVIPAQNEEKTVGKTVGDLAERLGKDAIPYEIIVVNDNSTDGTAVVIASLMRDNPRVRTANRTPPAGFGRAIRDGLALVAGDVVVICMADCSDDPRDVVAYYRKIQEGYDCVFGSRFMPGAEVLNYPRVKLLLNRLTNKLIQCLFWTRHNDLTNAFKAYRTHVIRDCESYRACHFNITIEMSLSALIRRYSIATIPVRWYGRTWGSSNLRIRDMGRRYLAMLLMLFFEKMLVADDLVAERLAHRTQTAPTLQGRQARPEFPERRLSALEKKETP